MPEPDEITEKAMQVYRWMALRPFEEEAPDLGFLFRLAGLKVGSLKSQEVYDRLMTRIALEREYRQKREGSAASNGHHSP